MRIAWEKTLITITGLTLAGCIWGVSHTLGSDWDTSPARSNAHITPALAMTDAPTVRFAAYFDDEGEGDQPVTAKITAQQAADAALKVQPGAVTEVELESENGRPVYEVKITANDGKQYKVQVDGDTAQVLVVIGNGGSVTAKITFQQAMDAALKVRPGTMTKTELESENGKAVYDVEIAGSDGKKYTVKVDGDTGNVLLVQVDSGNDDD